ncbi:hypothetical protein NOMA109596_06885 [Nocardioides marinus]|uniref:Uncharacterized protein n=1 Tax=Nocardioides marinus TaxID=374514 RepID=A0A7Y9YCT9_9ACTN|nr:hypothetical protein [Nocardioides marinus]NYI09870.1 hypothetical protein [Nocardioides marinus]
MIARMSVGIAAIAANQALRRWLTPSRQQSLRLPAWCAEAAPGVVGLLVTVLASEAVGRVSFPPAAPSEAM